MQEASQGSPHLDEAPEIREVTQSIGMLDLHNIYVKFLSPPSEQ
jgi:hypothetical protein